MTAVYVVILEKENDEQSNIPCAVCTTVDKAQQVIRKMNEAIPRLKFHVIGFSLDIAPNGESV